MGADEEEFSATVMANAALWSMKPELPRVDPFEERKASPVFPFFRFQISPFILLFGQVMVMALVSGPAAE